MFTKTISNRVKAAGIAALVALSAAAAFVPAITGSMSVNVGAVEIDNFHMGVKEKYIGYTAELASSGIKTITFTCRADYTGTFTYGFGIGTAVSPDYWAEVTEGEVEVTENEEFTVTIDVSKLTLSYDPVGTEWGASKYEFRNYYSGEDDGWIYVLSAEANKGSTPTTPTEGENPTEGDTKTPSTITGEPNTDGTTKNRKSGEWKFTDNGNGTGTMVTTQAKQMDVDYVLTAGYDEEYYEDKGVTPVEGTDPLNSHKFNYTDFGIGGIGAPGDEAVNGAIYTVIESLEATITSDAALKRFMYGGGMNVVSASPADTESAKVAAGYKESGGYWYNDMGTEVLEECAAAGVEFGITPSMGYDLSSESSQLGEYFSVVWDVPEEVQPWANNGAVSFQFWYGEQDAEEYTPAETVNLINGVLTYTETCTFDYTGTVDAAVNEQMAAGDMAGVKLADYLGESDVLKAVVFTVSAASDLDKLVYGVGASVDEDWKQWSDKENGEDKWDYCVMDTASGDVDIVWIVPAGVDINEAYGEVKLGYWYGGLEGKELDSVTLKNVSLYYYEDELPTEETTDAPTDPPTDEPTTEPDTEPDEIKWGDVNVSGEVDVADVIDLCKASMGAFTLTAQGAKNADVDQNGSADTTDASYILQSLIGLVTLPVK